MIKLLISIPVLAIVIYLVRSMINDQKRLKQHPSWPPTCNSDVEAKINELIVEIDILKKTIGKANEEKKS